MGMNMPRMKDALYSILLLALIALLPGCGERSIVERQPLVNQFMAQLQESSLTEGYIYQKTIENSPTKESEQQKFTLGSTSDSSLLEDELQYALQYYFALPRQREMYDTLLLADTILANVKPSAASKAELKSQKILVNKANNKISYLASHIKKDYWLYDLDIDIRVQMDSSGLYKAHQLDLYADILGFSNSLSFKLKGRRFPE